MKLLSDKEEIIFRFEREDGKVSYAKGMAHKLQDGTWEHGYIPVRFPKGTDLKNKTKIIIKEAWDDFFIKDNKTYPYYYINKFELASDFEAIKQVADSYIEKKERTYLEEQQLDTGEYPFQ